MSRYSIRIGELNCLAEIDESRDYEVDMSGIYTNGEKFYFISTSGCSCWDGDVYSETAFDSFADLKRSLVTEDVSDYNPSLTGVRSLIEQAESALGIPPTKHVDPDSSVLDWLSSNFG